MSYDHRTCPTIIGHVVWQHRANDDKCTVASHTQYAKGTWLVSQSEYGRECLVAILILAVRRKTSGGADTHPIIYTRRPVEQLTKLSMEGTRT